MGDRWATIDMGRKVGVLRPFVWGRAGSLSNTMWPGLRPTTIPSGILIHPSVWTQYTNFTDRQDRQRSDSIGRTVLGRPKRQNRSRFRMGCGLGYGPQKAHWRILARIPLNRLCAAAMRPFCQITLTTCYYHYNLLRYRLTDSGESASRKKTT